MISCALCHEKYFGDCGKNSRVSALDKVNSDGIYSAMATSTPQSDTVSKYSYSGNVSKIGDLSYGTLYIIIDNKGRYTNVYDNLNLDPKSHPLSSTIKNNTKVIWINLDRINKHGIELLDTNNGIKLLSSMIPFGGTVEYTFTSLGNYRFFDSQYKEMQGKIIVSSSIDISHVVSNKLIS